MGRREGRTGTEGRDGERRWKGGRFEEEGRKNGGWLDGWKVKG